ncbi:hypothetical protein Tco_1483955 [Tanacetum coccineum]
MENPALRSEAWVKNLVTTSSQPLTAAQLVLVDRQYEIEKANIKVDLNSLPCHAPSMIIDEILEHHSLKDALTLSASAPIIYMQQLRRTLQLADSKEAFKFRIDQQFLPIIGHDVDVQALGKFFVKHLHQPLQTLCKVLMSHPDNGENSGMQHNDQS